MKFCFFGYFGYMYKGWFRKICLKINFSDNNGNIWIQVGGQFLTLPRASNTIQIGQHHMT
jgi:hypothetical protein